MFLSTLVYIDNLRQKGYDKTSVKIIWYAVRYDR